MRALLALIDRLSLAAAIVAAACLALLAVAILAEVIAVTVFNRSLEFTWEAAAFLMSSAFFLGLGYTLNSGGHVRVNLLYELLPSALRPAIEIAATVVGLAIALFLTSAIGTLAINSLLDGSRTFTATATPLAIPQGIAALGAALLSLQLFARLVRLWTGEPADSVPTEGADV
ncbi:MAG: TRAP transporter small permease [Pseudomonadota bacterium]